MHCHFDIPYLAVPWPVDVQADRCTSMAAYFGRHRLSEQSLLYTARKDSGKVVRVRSFEWLNTADCCSGIPAGLLRLDAIPVMQSCRGTFQERASNSSHLECTASGLK